MTIRTVIWIFMAGTLLLGSVVSSTAACESDGEVQFLCGPVSPEDFAPLPESPWVVVSSMVDDGYLYLIDTRDHTATVWFPTETARPQQDVTIYGECPGLLTSQFRPHGLYLRAGDSGVHTLLVVRHGGRESIEVFEVTVGDTSPTITWVGCAVAPEGIGLNSVVALPAGGFAATSPRAGNIWKWHTDAGWNLVPGSEDIGPNGLEISKDGRWFYVGGYRDQALIRLSRGKTPVQKTSVPVGFHIDNVRWGTDEKLLAAGHLGKTRVSIRECIQQRQCDGITSRVAEVDPQRLTARQIVLYPSNDLLILGTVAIQVGEEIWVGGVAGGDRIARFPALSR